MRLCIVGKYPPIQGGVSTHTLWTAHCLAISGHEVHLVTNAAEVEDAYRLQEELYADQPGPDPRLSVPVHVHSSLGKPGSTDTPPRYIPYANPFVSKLAGSAARVAADARCDLLYSYYLEPYGVAAQLASAWTGIPYGLRHAGSDVTRLYKHADLSETYANISRNASFWVSGNNAVRRGLQHLGVPGDRFYTVPLHSLNTDYFKPGTDPMRLDEVGKNISRQRGFRKYHPYFGVRQRPGRPTIGIYGKIGTAKGTLDLLRAFAKARASAGSCNIVFVTGGTYYDLEGLYQAVAASGLSAEISLIPFMPPWKIPGFIAACDAVAFAERDFPIQIHHPTAPREVLACGTCLLLSSDVAHYQEYRGLLRDGANCLIADPRDTDRLAASLSLVIDDPAAAREIGRAGHEQISRGIEDWTGYIRAVSGTFEEILADVTERRFEMTVAEMQAALARLSADEAYRSWFELAPEAALDKYILTERERDALKAIDGKLLGLFAGSLRAKRRHGILGTFPLCQQVCGDQLIRYFDRFYDLHPADPRIAWSAQVLSFGHFLADCLAADSSVAAYAADLCRYELAIHELNRAVLPSDDLRLLGTGRAVLPDRQPIEAEARPILLPGVRVVSFGYDVPAILERLRAEAVSNGEAEQAPIPRDTNIVLRIGRDGMPEAFEVNAATAALLRLCSGDMTFAGIERAMAGQIGAGDVPAQALRQIFSQLQRMDIVDLASLPPGGAEG